MAAAVGLSPCAVFDVDSPWTYPDLPTALRGFGSSGVAFKAAETREQAALDAAHDAALAPFVQPDDSYRIGATFGILMGEDAG
jgi:hypothetical protein